MAVQTNLARQTAAPLVMPEEVVFADPEASTSQAKAIGLDRVDEAVTVTLRPLADSEFERIQTAQPDLFAVMRCHVRAFRGSSLPDPRRPPQRRPPPSDAPSQVLSGKRGSRSRLTPDVRTGKLT